MGRHAALKLLGLVCVLALFPSRAPADLSLRIGPQADPNLPDVQFSPASAPAGRQFFDLVFDETGVPADEGLFAYDVMVRLDRPAGDAGGIKLSGAEVPPDNFVFDVPGTTYDFFVYHSDDRQIDAQVANALALPNVTGGMKAARIFYTVDPAGLVPGDYRIRFGPDMAFATGRPGDPLAIPVSLTDQGVIRVVPEPGGLWLLAAGGMLAVWRWRDRRTA